MPTIVPIEKLIKFAAKQPPARARMVLDAIAARAVDESEEEALAAFERDMQPLCNAIVEALKAGDRGALVGLRAMLADLMAEINESPQLADVLLRNMGRSMFEGMKAQPEASE